MPADTRVPDDIHAEVERDTDWEGDSLMVSVSITEPSGVSWSATGHVDPPITDEALADLIARTALGAAAMRGSGVWIALQQRIDGGSLQR